MLVGHAGAGHPPRRRNRHASHRPRTTASTNAVLKRGSQGDAVKNVQEALRRLGYFEGNG